MPFDIYNKDFQRWLKGGLALNETREALCGFVTDKFGSLISTFPEDQRDHLGQFLICLNQNEIQQLKPLFHPNERKKKNEITCYCQHDLCKVLFERFVNEHAESATLPYKWEIIQHTPNSDTRRVSMEGKEHVDWRITALYMFVEPGENAKTYRCLDDLDVSKVIKLMRSCRLFVLDGCLEFYEEVMKFRNYLMHSPKYEVSEEYLQEKLQKARKLMETLGMSLEYKNAIEYLQKLGENDFIISYHTEEHKRVIAEVLRATNMADDLHKSIDETSEEWKRQSKHLKEFLENINNGCPDPQLEYKSRDFKQLVMNYIEKKTKAIELDKNFCGHSSNQGHNSDMYQQLQNWQDQAKRDLKDVKEQLKNADDVKVGDVIDHLNKEVRTLKKNDKKRESQVNLLVGEIEKCRQEIERFKVEKSKSESGGFSWLMKFIYGLVSTEDAPQATNKSQTLTDTKCSAAALTLPEDWEQMNGSENLKIVPLSATDQAYIDIEKRFITEVRTDLSPHTHLPPLIDLEDVRVYKIERIQNKMLYQQYQLKKEQLTEQKQNLPPNMPIERKLWHGTNSDAVKSIQMHGFNRSYSGKANGRPWYGEGVYFADSASYSTVGVGTGPLGDGYVFLVNTLTGQFCTGLEDMKHLPPVDPQDPTLLFDSAVNDTEDPTEFVIFNDTQAYPAYIVTFRSSKTICV